MFRFALGAFVALIGGGITAAPSLGPYAGEQARPIKALSRQQIADLRAGKGMGLAKAAELNGYPGPLHILELADELALSDAQLRSSREIFEDMRAHAIAIGERLVEAERELDELFRSYQAAREPLVASLARIASLQAELRRVHLQAHVDQVAVLEPEQVEKYAQLRGYRKESAQADQHDNAAVSHR